MFILHSFCCYDTSTIHWFCCLISFTHLPKCLKCVHIFTEMCECDLRVGSQPLTLSGWEMAISQFQRTQNWTSKWNDKQPLAKKNGRRTSHSCLLLLLLLFFVFLLFSTWKQSTNENACNLIRAEKPGKHVRVEWATLIKHVNYI